MIALAASLSVSAAVAVAAEPTGPEPTPPWSHKDVGDVAVKGDARLVDGVFAVTGTLDIWGKADGFHFVYQPLEGDGQVVARVTRVEKHNEHAKGGVMFRESLDPGARHATLVVTAVDGTQFLKRKETGDVTTVAKTGRDRDAFPYWVKVTRAGDTFAPTNRPTARPGPSSAPTP